MPTLLRFGDRYSDLFFSFKKKEKKAILYVRNIWKNESIQIPTDFFSLEYVAGKNIFEVQRKDDLFWLKPNSSTKLGGAIFLLTDKTFKKPMDPNKAIHSLEVQNSMKQYLEENETFDFSSGAIQDIVKKIKNELSFEKKDNPYWQALSSLRFVHLNIEYSRAIKEAVEKLEATIRAFPEDTVSSLLFKTFSYPEIQLRKEALDTVGAKIILPKEKQKPFQKALYILNEFDVEHPVFIVKWPFGKVIPASHTVCDGLGKCDCLAHVFIALCRSMGIPATKIVGNFDYNGLHAWALSYIHPFGFVEVDPTNTFEFNQFDHSLYYHCLLRGQFRGDVDFLNLKKPITNKILQSCKNFYEKSEGHPGVESFLTELEK